MRGPRATRRMPAGRVWSFEQGEVADVGDGADSGTATSDEPVERPNIILILTDDLADDDLSYMPNLRSLLIEQGTTFENAFVTDSLCCPSRATILRGQYAHNHGILENGPPNGGYEKFRSLGRQNSTLATWLQDAGYRTVLIGKYMNDYEGTQVPPGWDDWHAVSGNYTSHDLSENGKIVSYDPGSYYMTDVLADTAVDFIRDPDGHVPSFLVPSRPFFMWLGTTAPHQPADPAPRHANAFSDVSMPRPPSFDEGDVSDKPAWIRDNPPLDPEQIAYAEDLYRKRMQSMLAVDDMIGRLVGELRKSGELDNTYFFFTSDNGFHFGTHRLSVGKWTAYEEDISVPLIVRGPGVPKGRTLEHLVLNNDFAPTFADLGGAEIPDFVDGRTLRPLERRPASHGRLAAGFPRGGHGGVCRGARLRNRRGGAAAADRRRAALGGGGDEPLPCRSPQSRRRTPRPEGSEDPGPPVRGVRQRGERALRPGEGSLRARQRLRGCRPRPALAVRGVARVAARLRRGGLPRRRGRRALKPAYL